MIDNHPFSSENYKNYFQNKADYQKKKKKKGEIEIKVDQLGRSLPEALQIIKL